jgi:hypothetical protein
MQDIRFNLNAIDNNYLEFIFKNIKICPNKYTLRDSPGINESLKNWQLLGSADGINYKILKDHSNDDSLKNNKTCSWDISTDTFYTHFKILQNGQNHNNSTFMHVSGFEIYGKTHQNIQ